MDYDDNEFHSQNFLLIGEDNNKFSSGLRSFALPKIDLDEHLQVHLRFNSLIEPESLLGIQGQEASNWIERFSTGSTALEFSSSAAESCSISRRNNVWSEATSSESVEMLLKSVGQDDMTNKRTTVEDSDACSGSDCVNDHMDPSSQVDNLQSNVVQVMKNDPALLPSKCSENFSELNKDVSVVIPPVEDTSKSIKHEELRCQSSKELDAGSGGEKLNSPGHVVAYQCGSNEKFVLSKSFQGDSTFSQIDPSATSDGILAKDSVNLHNQNFTEQVLKGYSEDMLHDNSEALVTDDSQKMISQILHKGSKIDCQPLDMHAMESCADGPETSLTSEPKVESPVLLMEGYNEPVVSAKSDGLLEDIAYQIKISTCEAPFPVINDERSSDKKFTENFNADTTKLSTSGVNMDSLEPVIERSTDGSFQERPKVPLKEDTNFHIEHVMSIKNVETVDDCGGRNIETSVLVREVKLDSGNHLARSSDSTENSNSAAEVYSLIDIAHGTQENEKKEDNNLGIHLHELAFDGTESARIQECAEGGVLKNDRSSLGGTLNMPMKARMENAHSPNIHNEDGAKIQTLPSQDAGSLEMYSAVPPVTGSCDVRVIPLEVSSPENECTRSSASSDDINPDTDGSLVDKSVGVSIQIQNTCTPISAFEAPPANKTKAESAASSVEVLTMPASPSADRSSPSVYQKKEGHAVNDGGGSERDAINCKENSLQSVTLSKCNSEPHSLEAGSGDQNSHEPNCGSPTIISCSGHSHGKVEHQVGNEGLLDVPFSGNLPQVSSTEKADENKSSAHDPTENASENDRSFTFEVGSLAGPSEKGTGDGWKPFHNVQSYQPTQTGEGPTIPSGSYQSDIKLLKEISHEGHPVFGERKSHVVVDKNSCKDKNKPVSGSSDERAVSKRKSAKERPIHKQTAERNGKFSSTAVTLVGNINREMQSEKIRESSHTEGGGMKSTCAPTVQTSSLPDLNTAACAATLFHQPFSDSQQVQLRAQIFVYGSLIQGIPPDEACMVSAFGNTDGGHRAWEGVWRATVERFHNQKSAISNCETPISSRSGMKITNPVSRSSPLHSKGLNTPASIAVSKGSSPAIFSSTLSLPSPLWSFSTRDVLHSNLPGGPHLDSSQMFSPSHGYHSPYVRPYVGNSSPWLSQAPSPVPWIASSQSSALDFVSSSSFPAARSPVSVSATTTMPVELKRKTVSPSPDKQASANKKTRKRKKGMVSEELGQVPSVSQPQAEPDSSTLASKHLPTGMCFPLPSTLSTKVTSSHVSAIPPIISPTHFHVIGSNGTEQKVIFSEETLSKIEQAKLQAEDAASFAANAVRCSEDIWNQLAAQKNSGLASEIEMNLASAAVAVAAASSVAKAAAAAAKVASDAALQAKMMVDEALILNKTGNCHQSFQTGLADWGNDISRTTPVSILKGKDKTGGSNLIIFVAKEAARRVEAASAAAKRAENLDAVVKAAELAAEAVSQAGAIIAMGDPVPFTIDDLVEAGPDGYWKVRHSTAECLVKTSIIHREEQMTLNSADSSSKSAKALDNKTSNTKDMQHITDDGGKSSSLNEHFEQSTENCKGDVPGLVSLPIPAHGYENNQTVANLKENSIQEGSLVEVVSDEDGLRGVWISARVLNLEDGKAFVCYNDVSGRSKEWIPLKSLGDNAPRIRTPHPMTLVKSEGTRKRRRAVVGHYEWAVGDRVDAWVRDGWYEGIVTEKNKEDGTKLTIHFPAGGNSATVRAWNVRPSLIWNDGQWVEWSRPRENALHPYEGDTPKDKRRKLGRLEGENEKLPESHYIVDSRKSDELRPQILSAKDKIFSVGKNVREENNSDTLRIKRTGLQKVGSRVIFGVPKPGKKRKFMEVSKHYVSDKMDKISESTDSIKLANYLIPQASRGWKSTPKVELKGRQAGDPKPKVLKPAKSHNVQTRSAAEKVSSSISFESTSNGIGVSQDPILSNAKASTSLEEKSEKNLQAIGSFSNILGTAKSTAPGSLQQCVPGLLPSMKKTAFATGTELGMKGTVTHVLNKLANNEEKGSNVGDNPRKAIPDGIEPRRSNRRIQPTSRLLEGLQSSLIISKIPGVSHGKGTRSTPRNASFSRGNTDA